MKQIPAGEDLFIFGFPPASFSPPCLSNLSSVVSSPPLTLSSAPKSTVLFLLFVASVLVDIAKSTHRMLI